jgi:sugar phosphate isomerase/epimerase
MYIFSGFGDEISPDFQEQISVMKSLGINHLELRGAWDKNVMDLSQEELSRIKKILAEYDFRVSSIGSPIGKIKITDDFEAHFEKFRHAVEIAHFLEVKYIRIFSYYGPEQGNIDDYKNQIIDQMAKKARYAKEKGVILLNENELNLYGESPEHCAEIISTVNSPSLKSCFDPANFIIEGILPFDRAYPLLKDSIEYFHIKDGLPKSKTNGDIVCLPAGEGEGQIPQILADFAPRAKERDIFLSLEPHLGRAGQFSGFSGPDKFTHAANALKKIVDSIK